MKRALLIVALTALALFAGGARAAIPSDGGHTGPQQPMPGVGGSAAAPPQGQASTDNGVGGSAAAPPQGSAVANGGPPDLIPQDPSPENPLGLPGIILPGDPPDDGGEIGVYPPGGGPDGQPGEERSGMVCIIVNGECVWIIKGTNQPTCAGQGATITQDVITPDGAVYRWRPEEEAWGWIPDPATATAMCVDYSQTRPVEYIDHRGSDFASVG